MPLVRRALTLAMCLALLMLLPAASPAADYQVQTLADAAPADGVSAEIAAQLAPSGVKVLKGTSRTVCSLWLAKSWKASPAFKPSSTVLYPLEVGQLIGVMALKNKLTDFRGQEIAAGVYTVRYAHQPVDGNHVGTSVTRDFFVLLPAAQDPSPGPVAEKDLFRLSAMAAGTNHPAMLSLVATERTTDLPALRHLEEPDWWVLQVAGTDGGKSAVPLDVVVVGKAAE